MKKELNIFEKLENKDICYAVCVAITTFKSKGIGASGHDYFLIAELRHLEKLKYYKFKDNKNLVLERTLSDEEIDIFKGMQEKFIRVHRSGNGRVYELKSNPFKNKRYDRY